MSQAKCVWAFVPVRWNASSLIYLLRLGQAPRERVYNWFVRHNNNSKEDLKLQSIVQPLVIRKEKAEPLSLRSSTSLRLSLLVQSFDPALLVSRTVVMILYGACWLSNFARPATPLHIGGI
jgi:hypothetical protein